MSQGSSPLHSDDSSSSPTESNYVKSLSSVVPSRSDTNRKTPGVKDAVAGAFSGALAKTVVAPIERVKLLMQLQSSVEKCASSPTTGSHTEKSRGMGKYGAWQVARRVYKEQGLFAFWRGMYNCTSRRV